MQFIDPQTDPWKPPADGDAALAPFAHALLSPAQWERLRNGWPAGAPVGLLLANDAELEPVAADLPRLALIALQFPKWTDGRAYSQAHLLRSRYRFSGQVRATGEVLVDMMPLLQRNGFDAALLRADQSREAAERALSFFPAHYQGDVRGNRPLFARGAAAPQQGRIA